MLSTRWTWCTRSAISGKYDLYPQMKNCTICQASSQSKEDVCWLCQGELPLSWSRAALGRLSAAFAGFSSRLKGTHGKHSSSIIIIDSGMNTISGGAGVGERESLDIGLVIQVVGFQQVRGSRGLR